MAKRPHEDDDSSLDKDLMAMGISEDTKKSGGEHLKRQTEESINQDRKRHKVEKQSAASVKNAFEEENTSKECIIQQYSNYINHQSGIIDDLKCQLESARRQLEEHLVIIERLEKEKKDLTQRLSKQAGANLTYNSPNIADLSDENRPTKLAEDFSELYDNELTDAFESLCSKNEREKTQIMLEILKKSYELCHDSSQDHVNAVKNGFATLRIRYELGEVVKKSDEQASAITEQVEAATEMQESSRTTGFKESLPTTENRTDEYLKNGVMMEENLQLQPSEQEAIIRLSHQNEQTLPAISESRVKEGKIEECTEKPKLTYVNQSAAVVAAKRKISASAGESLETSNKFTEEQLENKPIVDINQEVTEGADEESHVIKSAAAGGDQAEAMFTEKQMLTGNKEQHKTNVPESKMLEDNNDVTPTKTQVTAEDEGHNGKEFSKNSLDNVEGDKQKKVTNLRDWKRNNNARKETKGVQCVPYKTLTAQFEKLTKEQMKTVSDIRKYFESELTESFQKKSADLIAKSLPEDMQKKELVHKYIQKCLQICWSMCRHEPPVFIHFIKPDTDTLFDTNVLRPYTKTGKYVDYVVWPPLYLYKDGPMLSKGIAQGRK